MNLEQLLDRLKNTPSFMENVTHWETIPAREAVYEDFPGRKESTFGLTRWEDLPQAARTYLTRLSEVAGCPIALVSTGPDRNQTILMHDPFN